MSSINSTSTDTTSSLCIEYQLLRENIAIQEQRLTQLYVIQSARDPFRWYGTLFIDSGIYVGAIVRMTIIIGKNYPNSPCPYLYFDPIPYHPLVEPNTGQLDTKNAFPVWDSRHKHRLYHLLAFAKRVLLSAEIYFQSIDKWLDSTQAHPKDLVVQNNTYGKDPNDDNKPGQDTTECHKNTDQDDDLKNLYRNNKEKELYQILSDTFLNTTHTKQAIELYNNNKELFRQKASDFVYECSQRVYDPPKIDPDDEHAIIFHPWEPEIHEPLRMRILNPKSNGQFNLYASYDKNSNSVNFVPGSSSWDC